MRGLETIIPILGALGVALGLYTAYRRFWRPGTLDVIHLPSDREFAPPGGVNAVPDRYRVALALVVHNIGARPARLDRITVSRLEVEGPQQLAERAEGGQVIRDPEGTAQEGLPDTIGAGEKLRILFKFEFAGLARRVAGTQPTPDLTEFAECLRDLEALAVLVRLDYWRESRVFRRQASLDLRVPLDVVASRKRAVGFWGANDAWRNLAEIARRPDDPEAD